MSEIIIFEHTLHKEQWNYLAEHAGMEEATWPGWEEHNRVFSSSFMCEYAYKRAENTGDKHIDMCTFCPFGMGLHGCVDSVYWQHKVMSARLVRLLGEYLDEERKPDEIRPDEDYLTDIGNLTGVLPYMARFIRDLPLRHDIDIVTR